MPCAQRLPSAKTTDPNHNWLSLETPTPIRPLPPPGPTRFAPDPVEKTKKKKARKYLLSFAFLRQILISNCEENVFGISGDDRSRLGNDQQQQPQSLRNADHGKAARY